MDSPLCAVSDIPEGGSKGFNLDKHASVFAVRKDDQVFVYKNSCPHAGLELNWVPDRFLDRDKEYILCSAHGAMFEIYSGFCIAGPCAGAELSPVDFQIKNDRIYLQWQG
ncbi:MAG: Rieske (2Fe-2S) protein [Gammaproteobacteria bacterium]|nr:MAG: Rieske (2Fe-2S) protein [Gammaproteobacteria bacterium]RLA54156.1 MAG: Rieske (2Fe-2S) protein [Gammaproteobacteria bacterium]